MESIDKAIAGLVSRRRAWQAESHEALIALAAEPRAREEVASKVEALLDHKDPEVRGTAFIVLATARNEQALPTLEAHAADREPGPRCDLAQAASVIGSAAKPLMRRLLGDPVFEVRFAAAAALADLSDAGGFEVLVTALERSGLRFQALSALQSLGDARAREPVRKLFKRLFLPNFERTAAAGVLARLGDAEARAFILERAARRKAEDRGYAIDLAGELKLEEASETLVKAIADREDQFRGAAARALGQLADGRAGEILERILLDEDEELEVRMDAAEGLMYLTTPQAREALRRASEQVRPPELQAVVHEALES